MKNKILQIIPAPPGSYAEYPPGGEPIPVVCLALVEADDGSRGVEPMVSGAWGIALVGGECAFRIGSSLASCPDHSQPPNSRKNSGK